MQTVFVLIQGSPPALWFQSKSSNGSQISGKITPKELYQNCLCQHVIVSSQTPTSDTSPSGLDALTQIQSLLFYNPTLTKSIHSSIHLIFRLLNCNPDCWKFGKCLPPAQKPVVSFLCIFHLINCFFEAFGCMGALRFDSVCTRASLETNPILLGS